MKVNKLAYDRPASEIFELKLEGNILQESLTGNGFSEPKVNVEDASDENWWSSN